MIRHPPSPTLFPYPPLFQSRAPAGTYPCRASLLIPSHPWRPASIGPRLRGFVPALRPTRSEEHTSELQSQSNLVCRLLLEKKKRQFLARRRSYNVEALVTLG